MRDSAHTYDVLCVTCRRKCTYNAMWAEAMRQNFFCVHDEYQDMNQCTKTNKFRIRYIVVLSSNPSHGAMRIVRVCACVHLELSYSSRSGLVRVRVRVCVRE